MKELILILMGGVLINNYVLQRFLGICPFLGVSKKFNQASGMGIAVIFVMLCATAVTYPIQKLVLDEFGLGYLQTIVFILVIAALVQFVEIVLKKFIPALHKSLGVYLPLITTNCAVLGVAILVVSKEFTFGSEPHMLNLAGSVVYAIASALGFGLAMTLFAGLREQLDLNSVPKAMKGVPIALVTAGILAMAFMGFSGLV